MSYYNSEGHSEDIKSLFNQNLDHSKQFIGKTISANTYGIIESYNNHILLKNRVHL